LTAGFHHPEDQNQLRGNPNRRSIIQQVICPHFRVAPDIHDAGDLSL
jgi:hypothetical protein